MACKFGLRASVVMVGLGFFGCAAAPLRSQTRAAHAVATSAAPNQNANGTWDWIFRSTDPQGDMRLEQEEWHLTERCGKVEGYYDRSVTMMSTDERLFRCNQRLSFTKTTRVRVVGELSGEALHLHEVAYQVKPGPCEDGARSLVDYAGTLSGGTLMLRWAQNGNEQGGGQVLVRRSGGEEVSLVPASNLASPITASATEPARSEALSTAPVEGVWQWRLRSIDAEGDERDEIEEWHLTETVDGITGYYDRTVARARPDGQFSCNGDSRFTTATRYTVQGQRFGDRISISEVEYQAAPSGCDNAMRRLDNYQGHLSDENSLVLTWGQGNQVLHRKK